MKRIGILGGISHASTIKYYELICKRYYDMRKDYYFPEIVIFSLDFQKFTDFEDSKDSKDVEYVNYIMEGISALENAGVDFIIMAANSPHAVFNDIKKLCKVPLINITEVTAKAARAGGMKKLLLLGIKFTMQSLFYKNVCAKFGIEVIVPSEEEQDEINEIIFNELVLGILKIESKNKILEIIGKYDIDGVILGCTELPSIIKQEDVNFKVLNTLELHAEAALEYALRDG